MGVFPGFKELNDLLRHVPLHDSALAILPILFISFGVDELAKVM